MKLIKRQPLRRLERTLLQTALKLRACSPRKLLLYAGRDAFVCRMRVAHESLLFATLCQLQRDGFVRLANHQGQASISITCRGIAALNIAEPSVSIASRVMRQHRLVLAGLSSALAACSSMPHMNQSAAGGNATVGYGVTQVRESNAGKFVICNPCLAPTPKTRAELPALASTEFPATVALPTVQRVDNPTQAAMTVATELRGSPELDEPAHKLYFESGRFDLNEHARAEVEAWVQRAIKAQHIQLQGTADATGRVEVNERLAEQRAAKVRELLISKGVREDSISVAACITCYDAENDSSDGRRLNRRVDVKILM